MEDEYFDKSGVCSVVSLQLGNNGSQGKGLYCAGFAAAVKLQGSGLDRDGKALQYLSVPKGISYYYLPKDNSPLTADGAGLIADMVGARDKRIIPAKGVSLDVDGVGVNIAASDTGDRRRIAGYRLDVFKGSGKAVCKNFANPVGVTVCSPDSANCPGRTRK